MLENIWLIPAVTAASFFLILFFGKRDPNKGATIGVLALGVYRGTDEAVIGQVFALFVIAVAAAEVGIGLAIVLLIYRNRRSIDLTEVDLMKG